MTAMDRHAQLGAARDLRAARRIPEALAALARLEAEHPRFSRLYQERGHCHVLLRDAPAAIGALREAVRLNPTLPACWDMLARLYQMRGDGVQAAGAARQLALLDRLPPAVVMANSLLADGDLAPAERVIRDYLRNDRDNVGARRLLARILTEGGAFDEAEAMLMSVLELAPDYHDARFDHAMLLLQRQKPVEARRHAAYLLRHDPDNRAYLRHFAAACIAQGDYEPVIDIHARLLADMPPVGIEVADLRLWRANALKTVGRSQEAVADYRAALVARPDYGVAWFGLSNLKTCRFADADIARMAAAEAQSNIQEMDRIYLNFALGKALEEQGDHAGSWRHYARGNALRQAAGRYRPEATESYAVRARQVFTPAFFEARAGWGLDDPAPIFVLGLPRSGSTLIEQILASHPQVEGTQELTEIGRYAAQLCGVDPDCGLPENPQALERLTAADAQALGERYLAETRHHRRLGRPFFIDKMPNNVWHVGLIQLILPRATIIDMRREPMGCCFSNLKQLFGTTNQPFTYGMEDIGRYYRSYLDLMRHWDAVLPGRVLRVHYEDVVDDLERSVRRILHHMGLAFDDACLSFHETRRSIRTPSSEQVRQPIGREGLTQWQHYAPWLAPLRAVLGDALAGYRG